MPKLDLEAIPQSNRTGYPPPYDEAVAGRWVRRLRPAAGLSALGAAHVVLKPGAWSSQRHWHAEEDELVVILSGEAVLVEDDGPGLATVELAERGRSGAGSTGLGLDVARRTAERAGGRLTLASGSSGGARIVLELPPAP